MVILLAKVVLAGNQNKVLRVLYFTETEPDKKRRLQTCTVKTVAV